MTKALNELARKHPASLEDIARWGGREMLEQVEEGWAEKDQMIYLHILNLKRRLRKVKETWARGFRI
eukprot:s626_g13.t1